MARYWLPVLALFSVTPTASAQTEQDFAMWSALFTAAELTPSTPGPSLWLDLHARRSDPGTVLIVRPGAGLRATPWLSVWAGYAWVPTFDDATSSRHDEHRIWQQVILAHTWPSRVSLQSRTRFEQRFSDGVAHRVREFVRLAWMAAHAPLGLVAWDELFVGLNDAAWGPRAGYDQNRLFVGVAVPVGWARFEAGYLLVHLNREPKQVAHAVAINVFLAPRVEAAESAESAPAR